MAEVFRVKAFGVEGFQKTFALKRILPHISEDPEFITMFIDEAKIASRLHHGNICQIYEFGRVGDFYFQLMEYIAGFDLRTFKEKLAATNKKLPLPFLLHVVARACEGMDYAHRKTDSRGNSLGIIHRDVSPQNVMVSFEGTTKLIDFGIAKAKSRASQTQAGVIKGKFAYMPPELLRGETIDGRADVFSLGIVLHELLTGQGLFDRETDLDTLRAVMAAEVPLPSSIDPAIPDYVDRVVLKALTALPADRYANAEEFQEDLERCVMMTGQPMSSNKVRKFMAKQFPDELQIEQEKAQRFAAFSETGEVALPGGEARKISPKTVETFSGRRLKRRRVKVRGANGLVEEVTIVHGSHETGESDYDEDDLQADARPDSVDQWQREEGYDDAFDPDELEEVEGILLDDADELDFMEEPTSVRMKAASSAGGAPVMEVDLADLATPLVTDAELEDGVFLDEADLIEEGEVLDGEDLVEEADLIEEGEVLDGDDLLEVADLIEDGEHAPGDEDSARAGAFSPDPALAAVDPSQHPFQQAYDAQQHAEEYDDKSEGEYEEGEYEEGEYEEGEYEEGEYEEGEYEEGEYEEGEYEEGEYEEGEYEEGEYEEGEYAEGEYAEGEYEEGEYEEGEYEEGEYEDQQPTGPAPAGQYAAAQPPAGDRQPAYDPATYAEEPVDGYGDSPYADDEGIFEPAPVAQPTAEPYAAPPEAAPESHAAPSEAAPESYAAPPEAAPESYAASPEAAPDPPAFATPGPADAEEGVDGDPLHDSEDATTFDLDAADAIRAKFAEMIAAEKKKKSDESEVMELGEDDLEIVDD